MAWVYILRCSDGSYYVGSTTDLDARIVQHGDGRGSAYTRRRLPVALIWSIELESVREAFFLEKRLQNWSRAKREALISGQTDLLSVLSSRSHEARRYRAEEKRRR